VAAPAIVGAARAVAAALFLAEFLSDGRWPLLSAVTAAPAVRPVPAAAAGRPVAMDLYTPVRLLPSPALVLVHGLSPEGKDDARLRHAAALLARAGFRVAVPTVEGLTRLRLRPEDAGAVMAAAEALRREGAPRVSILAVSVGAGPAFLAAADPALAPRLSGLLALGGYASARELLRYTLTGSHAREAESGRGVPDEAAIALFAAANTELMDEAGRRFVANRDPAAVDGLFAALPPGSRQLLSALSPEEAVGRIRAPLFLVHGRNDPAVPYAETLRLARAAARAGGRAQMAIVGAVGHVEPGAAARWADLWRLWRSYYAFAVTSAGRDP
jgi:pimeloyl-ACP methyl ester carboxylesterase